MSERMIAMARPVFTEQAVARVAEAILAGQVASGPRVVEFEQALAQRFGYAHVAACSNGTTALHAALLALGVTRGDTVVTPALSFVASASPVVHAGATPLFCDVDDSFNLDPARLDGLLQNRRVAAVIFVHLYGNPTNVARVAEVCARHGVPLVEDCAQAHGATLGGRVAGTFGEVAALSFYATKNLATGEGGAVVSATAARVERVRKLINHGRVSQYEHDVVGYNYRMTDIQALLGLDQLAQLDENQRRRDANAARLRRVLEEYPDVEFPRVESGAEAVHHQFTIALPLGRRDALAAHLLAYRIRSAIVYPTPLPRLQCFRAVAAGEFPVAEDRAGRCLSLPVHAALDEADLARIEGSLRRFF